MDNFKRLQTPKKLVIVSSKTQYLQNTSKINLLVGELQHSIFEVVKNMCGGDDKHPTPIHNS